MTANDWLLLLFRILLWSILGYSMYWVGVHGGDFVTKMKRRRHRCQNCHFLIKKSPQLPSTCWTQKDRDDKFPRIGIPPNELEHDKWGRYKGYDMTVGCHKEFWSMDHNEMDDFDRYFKTRELDKELTLNRGESCFFVPYYEGMPMKTAEELFSVKSENRRTNKRIIWTQIGLVVALATSIASMYLQLSK